MSGLHPQVAALLERAASAGLPKYYDVPPAVARRLYRDARGPLSPEPPPVEASWLLLAPVPGGPVPVLVTAAINRVEFHQPVFVGDVVRCLVRLVRFGRTSITVLVTVEAERGTESHKVTEAEVVFVHVGLDGRPQPIPAAPQAPRPAHSGSGTKGSKQRRQRAS